MVSAAQLTARTLGDFRLQKQVGAGGFGEVYLAEQVALKRDAVVKVLRPELRDASHVEQFLREAQLASQLDHPYAAHIYAFGAEPDGVLWIAMELVRGSTLAALLAAQGPMPVERFVPLLERICEVVHTAHEQGIVHRDVKPSNVMVIARAGRLLPKLLDFGIARALGSSRPLGAAAPTRDATMSPTGVGTPGYMAPELWIDPDRAGAAADQYALGVLCYEALTNREAFTGRSILEIARAHSRRGLPSLGAGFGELDLVLKRATALKAADRYSNVLELAVAFRAAAGIGAPSVELPRLDDELRTQLLLGAPRPIADAVAAYDAARNPHQARDALQSIVRIASWYVGIVAVACRTRVGPGPSGDADRARQLVRDLRRQALTAQGWVALARELARPFARAPDTHPLPELVMLLHPPQPSGDAFAAVLEGALLEALPGTDDDTASQAIARELPGVAALLRELRFLLAYRLVVPRSADAAAADAAVAESWMGARTDARQTVQLPRAIPVGRPVLVEEDGTPLLVLAPLVAIRNAVPGHGEEMFFLSGPGRTGARLVSSPRGFEFHDPTLWDWYREHLFDETVDGGAAVEEAPYRGLAAYSAGDASWFFGRERETDGLVNRLRLESFVAVVGPSGVGKSSFIAAGLVPALDGWHVVSFRPGANALAQLIKALALDGIEPSAAPAAIAARCLDVARARPTLIIVDQFEEVFTLGARPADRARFVAALLAIARSARGVLHVVITMRDDFLIRAEQIPGLDDALARGLHLLGPLGPAALERILIEPARRLGYEFEDAAMPARMIEETADIPSAVALISFTASRLWELRDRHFHHLPRKAYEALGGVAGALARHADETVDAMPAGERALVRRAFRHLVTFEGTRAVLAREELEHLLGGNAEATRIVERLIAARLLVTGENERGEVVVELIHEALVSAWPRLTEWRREDVEGSRLHEQLRAAARQWSDRGRPRGLLWRGEALVDFTRWRARHGEALTPLEAAFGAASTSEAARGRRIRRLIVGAALVVLSVFVVALWRANGEARTQAARAEDLLRDSYYEQGRLIMLQGDRQKAVPMLGKAYRMGVTDAGIRLLIEEALRTRRAQQFTVAHGERIWDVAYTPDGALFATASQDGTVGIWDATSGADVATVAHGAPVSAMAVSPDGAWIASGALDNRIQLWSVRSRRVERTLDLEEPVCRLVFARGGAELVATGKVGAVRIFDAATGARLAALPAQHGLTVATPCSDGTCLATADETGQVVLWDRASLAARTTYQYGGRIYNPPVVDLSRRRLVMGGDGGTLLVLGFDGTVVYQRPQAHNRIVDLALSPDGDTLVTVGDTEVKVWDVAQGTQTHVLAGHRANVWTARFSLRGDRIVTASADGTARIWSRAGTQLAELGGHSDAVFAAQFRPDGAQVVTASWDHRAFAWDVRETPLTAIAGLHVHVDTMSSWESALFEPGGHRVAALEDDAIAIADLERGTICRARPPAPAWRLAWSRDGAQLATTSEREQVIRIWDTACQPVRVLEGHTAEVPSIAFGEHTLASASGDGTARTWDLATGQEVARFDGLLSNPDDLGYLPDGQRFYVMSADLATGKVTICDPSRQTAATLVAENGLSDVVIDTRRGRLLAGGFARNVWVWDLGDLRLVQKLDGGGPLWGVRISPEGTYIVGLGPFSPTVWDAATLRPIGQLEGHTDFTVSGDFIDERVVVTTSQDGTARVWDVVGRRQLLEFDGLGVAVSADRRGVLLLGAAEAALWRPAFPPPAQLHFE
jgi:WD40 repeat protein